MAWIEEMAVAEGWTEIRVGVRRSLPRNLSLYRRLGYELLFSEPHPKGGDVICWLGKRSASEAAS
jgi:hypothetical protein